MNYLYTFFFILTACFLSACRYTWVGDIKLHGQEEPLHCSRIILVDDSDKIRCTLQNGTTIEIEIGSVRELTMRPIPAVEEK